MDQISVERYLEGVESIYREKPTYKTGHDGSDGQCDCIGMCRGALKREGVTGIKNMNGTNTAARKTIVGLAKIESTSQLCLGDVVLKVRDKDDPDMPLPDKFRKGGADYDPTWGETNFTHIGTVTGVDPLEITHMTSPTAKKDTKIGNWVYFGVLPWVASDVPVPDPQPEPEPGPEPEPAIETATVMAPTGGTVKMRAKPTTSCSLYWDVPVFSIVDVLEKDCAFSSGENWSKIQWTGRTGFMMSKFLNFNTTILWTVHIPHLTEDQARALLARYPGSWMISEEGGAVL